MACVACVAWRGFVDNVDNVDCDFKSVDPLWGALRLTLARRLLYTHTVYF